MQASRADFPEGFLFGVATSAYQIEGHAFGGAGPTHWDSFAATPGNVVRAENGERACDHYHRFEEDLDLISGLGADVYRFSTSWARVLPDGTGQPNHEGLDFYDRLVDGMLARGIRPAATLYHWELPQPLADKGGWRNADMPNWFADFTQTVMSRIGDRVWSAAPINEPWCVGWLSHFDGAHAPGLRDIRATARAMHHVLKSHGAAIEVMRGLGMKNLGAVCNFEWAAPASDDPADMAATARYDAIYNRFFLGGLFKGEYPPEVLEGLEPHLPKGWQDDFALIGTPLDWIGVNYYTRKRIRAGDGPWPAYAEAETVLPLTQMGWEIYPDGLRDFLLRTAREYSGDLPIYVTENGMANPDLPDRPDTERIDYLDAHLSAVREAIAGGAPVSGYFVWSLMDNYEWSLGYEKRFGLVHVDFETLARTPKASYEALARWWRAQAS
ncbi:GH1 family beta-glucosidase [Roseibacterium sp. SDUM158016]|uniref:GH1 family beta-glucosidase n=1 Tax=Roseicyclus sediminis TaxID=2980997 RepID=UPI0021D16726|nr:GH1 family beta-glucosidase [Roseibacterium sp. SDUM158016]MCU4653592.1 GH1 family beta-glucosidase [Roseibacterium sp. SDUM158016]